MIKQLLLRHRGLVLTAAAGLLTGCASLGTGPAAEAYQRGQWQQAARGYQAYTARNPDSASAWYRLGNARAELGELEAAEQAYRRALALDPQAAQVRHNLGLVMLQQGVEALLAARRELPAADPEAEATMRYLACLMETFMGHPEPQTCRPGEQP